MPMAFVYNKLGFDICCTVGSGGKEGKSGGLALGWRPGVDIRVIGSSVDHIDAMLYVGNNCLRITGFYGHPETSLRSHSWELLRRISSTVTGAWFVFGDFNELIGHEEKLGGCIRPNAQMRKFQEAILDCGLQEVQFSSPMFTWSNGHTWEWLDREVIQAEWELSIKAGDVLGCLQNIGKRLQRWNKEKVGNIPKKVVLLREELQRLPFDDTRAEVQERRKTVKQELTKYTAYEEELWAHRSRVTWMKAGDSNTKFFHNYVKSRGWRNKVMGICCNTPNLHI
ncbi:hypothetical protein M0R45_006113 [Rubus argutus]|uniref:Endonuclease/exonuclease/phosphatase domain-containing protein n=1 Tax=Rubus argutus TaxID=59490 RepID=A0AAW1YQ32_RUBAR